MIDIGTMTEYKIPVKKIDLEYYFPYGEDKQIQVVESEIFDFDKEAEPLV